MVRTNGSEGQHTLSGPKFVAAPKSEIFDEPAHADWQSTLS